MIKLIKGKPKIFCVSFQRTGTTSTGQFFKDHGYKVANHYISSKNQLTFKWFRGDYKSIFSTKCFKNNQVFEDDPWWCGDFYKYLFHAFPDSKFILLERNPDDWFDSMISHSDGSTLGNTHVHCSLYRRELEFHDINSNNDLAYSRGANNLLSLNENHRKHYIDVYNCHNTEVKIFFEKFNQKRLFNAQLNDSSVWSRMGDFFEIDVSASYKVHENKSIRKVGEH